CAMDADDLHRGDYCGLRRVCYRWRLTALNPLLRWLISLFSASREQLLDKSGGNHRGNNMLDGMSRDARREEPNEHDFVDRQFRPLPFLLKKLPRPFYVLQVATGLHGLEDVPHKMLGLDKPSQRGALIVH